MKFELAVELRGRPDANEILLKFTMIPEGDQSFLSHFSKPFQVG
jgi:hypothetical protein